MALNGSLGTLERVDLREVWASEASGFTPWLAREESLARLGEVLGLDLELEAQEKFVGPFRADLLCRDTMSGKLILIENQLERTDHIHLGQIFTYAAGLRASTMVWVAARFTDEHRAAIDWINDVTDSSVNFFGLEIELWRIGDSPPAPKFNVVSRPNDWAKTVHAARDQLELSETQQLQFEYWTAFVEALEAHGTQLRARAPQGKHWMEFAIGRTNFKIHVFANTRDKRIGVILVLSGSDAKAHFDLLQQEKDAIESEIGVSLEWRRLPEKKESRISYRVFETDPANVDDWPRQHALLVESLNKYHAAFHDRIRQLDASNAPTSANADDETADDGDLD